ncbi:Sec-independent protein translocase protein TatB [Psychrobacter sp. NG27]|uniref:Sec-independent protein translocase protein TatB n=1 Tax=Psychrobacter sp. NG27 TaxID=2781966 RepID=UPI0018DFAEED|nr:Sec-independent protein translocase protein TatB [Psychrobacter sp. NG27]MBI0427005.1 twin-arginine translocase subunit TatB [Psychrobacter sp. NG27]
MFDIGFSELLLFGVIALIVLGPEKLPQAARTAGQWYAKIRRTVSTLQSEIEAELDLAETRQQMQKELAKIRQTEADMKREMAEMRGNMKAFENSQSHSLKTSNDSQSHDSDGTRQSHQAAKPKAFDYAYATDEQNTPMSDSHQTLEADTVASDINDDANMSDEHSKVSAAPAAATPKTDTPTIVTRPWENMWFRLGTYDKARRLPMPPYLPNYKADTLLNSPVSMPSSVKNQEAN